MWVVTVTQNRWALFLVGVLCALPLS